MNLIRRDLLKYAILAFPLAFAGLPIYVHAPDFYATQFNQSLITIGLILLFLRVIDAVQDPFIGMISDKYHIHRSKIMMVGMALLAGGFFMIFHPSQNYILIWFALSVFLCTTGFSIVTINLQASGGLWSVDTHQRTRVSSWREGVGLIGLLVASVTPTALMMTFDTKMAFHLITLGYIPILIVAGFIFLNWLKSASLDKPENERPQKITALFQDAWFQKFAFIFVLSSLASAIPGVLVLFFIRDYLELESQTGLFLLLYFVAGAAAMPLWMAVSGKLGKIKTWLLSMVLASITFIWAFGLDVGDATIFYMICVLSGLALGADLALPPAIVADYIARKKTQNLASRYYAMMAFLSKGALALATGITLPLLGLMGYQPGSNEGAENLPLAYAFIPCFIKITAAILLFLNRYKLNTDN